MSSNFNPIGLDVAEQLRRRQLLQDMSATTNQPQLLAQNVPPQQPVQAPVPQIQPAPAPQPTINYGWPTSDQTPPSTTPQTTVTPPDVPQPVAPAPPQQPAYDPTAQLAQYRNPYLENLPKLNVPPLPDMSGYRAAASALANIPPEDIASAKLPSGQPEFPRNKLLTALVAPLMLKQYIRNPQQASAAMDFMTRKGYGAYRQQYEQNLASKERTFGVQRDVAKANVEFWKDQLQGTNTALEYQAKLAQLYQSQQMFPLEQATALANLDHIRQQTNAEKWDTNPWTIMTKDGPRTALLERPVNPKDKPQFYDLTTMTPVTEYSNPTRMSAQTELNLDKLWLQAREQEARAKGIPLDRAFYDQAEKDMQKTKGTEAWERLLEHEKTSEEQLKEREANQLKLAQQREQHSSFLTAASNFRKVSDAVGVPLEQQNLDINQAKQALLMAKDAARTGNKAGVIAASGKIKYMLSTVGGIKAVNRYNTQEIETPDYQSGRLNQYIAQISNWFGSPTGAVPMEAIDQMLRFINVLDRDTKMQQAVIDKYKGEVTKNSKTNDLDAMSDIDARFHADLQRVAFMEPKEAAGQIKQEGQKNLPTQDEMRKKLKGAR